MVKHRNIFLVYLFTVITLGIYYIYWIVSTKNEMNSLGAKIPTAWLLIVPIVNIYWFYKYCEGFAVNVKRDNNTILWFVLWIFVGFLMPLIIQLELNKWAGQTNQPQQEASQPMNGQPGGMNQMPNQGTENPQIGNQVTQNPQIEIPTIDEEPSSQ